MAHTETRQFSVLYYKNGNDYHMKEAIYNPDTILLYPKGNVIRIPDVALIDVAWIVSIGYTDLHGFWHNIYQNADFSNGSIQYDY